jgi:fibronectin-binding autotransporter adhesin
MSLISVISSKKLSSTQGALLGFFLATTIYTPSFAVTVNDVATLTAAINALNAGGSDTTITIASPITLTTSGLPAITKSVTINGSGGAWISGANLSRIFVIDGGAGTNVTISDITLKEGKAIGGTGSGGGMGAGGAIYVGATSNVTVTNVTLSANNAVGGAGGSNLGNGTNALGGGGMLGAGNVDGTGGTSLTGGAGGLAGVVSGTKIGGTGANGAGGGGGADQGQGGLGGFGGGGGGTLNTGAATGGAGGFGGGGGAAVGGTGGAAGFAGGAGSTTGGGGGGAGLGGAIFVQGGGTLTIGGSGDISATNGATSAGGLGGVGAANGLTAGGSMFLQGAGTLNLTPGGAGNTTTIGGQIADQYGMASSTSGMSLLIPLNGLNRYDVNITGPGTVVLGGNNTYSGKLETVNGQTRTIGTTVSGGAVVQISNNNNLGNASGQVRLNDGEVKLASGGGDVSSGRGIIVESGGGTLNSNGHVLTHSGIISGTGILNITGAGAVNLSGTNSYSGGTNVNGGNLGFNTDANLGTGGLTLANAGTLTFNSQNGDLSRAVTLVGTGNTINSNGYNTTLLGTISGPGQLAINNTGTGGSAGVTQLSNVISTAGGVQINNGTLKLIDQTGTPGGSITGAILNNGVLDVSKTGNTTLNNMITGSGSLVKNGTGNLLLGQNNTYNGSTTVNGGTLTLGTGGTTGGVAGAIALNGGNLAVNRSDTLTLNNNITGNGNVAMDGTGTLTLGGTNSFTGDLLFNKGLITAGTSAALGNGNLIFNGGGLQATGAFDINRPVTLNAGGGTIDTNGNNLTGSSVIGGVGALTKKGAGDLTLSAANSYAGGTVINGGSVILNGNGTLGTGVVDIQSPGNLTLSRTGVFANGITGNGSLVANSGGLTQLTGNGAGFTGITTIGANTNLSLGAGGTTGSLGGNIVNNGTLTSNRSDASIIAGDISGGGKFVQSGGPNPNNLTVLSGTNTYTGGTRIDAGTLQLGNGATTGSVVGDITLNGGTLAVSRSDAVTLANNIVGTGNLAQNGTGITTLTGANTFTGGIAINNGGLAIGNNGELGNAANDITISNGAALIATNTLTLTRDINLLNPGGGTLQVSSPNTLTVAGVISGPGLLTTTGTGTTILTGANTNSGGTAVTGGTLEVGTGGTLGTGAVALNTGTNLNFNSPGPLTIANPISGGGTVNQNGTGTTTVTGANTYTGGTNVNAGVLAIGNGGTLGTGGVNLAPTGTLAVNTTTPFTLTNPLTGTGTLALNAPSTTITGLNPLFAGTTNVNTGTLSLGNGTDQGSLGGTINTGAGTGVIVNPGTGTVTIPANIQGAGTLTTNGTGTTVLTGNNNLGGGTTIAGGTLQLGNGTTQGSLGGNITNNGILDVKNPNPTTLVGTITGTGGVNIQGPGTPVTMLGNNTYAGPTTIAPGGGLILGNGGTTGSVTGNIVNNGTLGINRSDVVTLPGNISGTGNVNILGPGTVNLTGTSSYTGTTTVSNGVLNVTGNLLGPVTTTGTGQINVSGTMTGPYTANGTGTLATGGTLNGPLTIGSTGNYVVNGTVTGPVTVNAGGTLSGTGRMGSINLGGTFAPGNSVGTATVVAGDLTMQPTGILQVEASPTASDMVNISGQAKLAGTYEAKPYPAGATYSQGYRYTPITATNGVVDQFTTFQAGTGIYGANIRPVLEYNANTVQMVLQAERLTPLTTTMSQNNRTMAAAFDASTAGQAAASTTNGTSTRGVLTSVYNATVANMSNVLDQYSGQVSMGAGTSAMQAGGGFMSAMMGSGLSAQPDSGGGGGFMLPSQPDTRQMFQPARRISAGTYQNPYDETQLIEARPYDKNHKTRTVYSKSVSANNQYVKRNNQPMLDYTQTSANYRKFQPQYAGWGQAMGGFSQANADATLGVNQTTANFAGVTGGYTYRPEKDMVFGVALAGVHTGTSVANNLGSGTGNGMSLGAYGRVDNEKLYAAGTLGVGVYKFDTTRQQAADTLKGSYGGTWLGGRGEVGVTYQAGKAVIAPYVALQTQRLLTTGYTEANQVGANTGLTLASRSHTSTRSEVGVNVETRRHLTRDHWMTVRGMIAWSHEYTPVNNMAAYMTALPGAAFVLQGAKAASDSILLAASAEMQIQKQWSINARIGGEFSKGASQVTGTVGAKYSW